MEWLDLLPPSSLTMNTSRQQQEGRQAAVGKSVLLVRQLSLLSITWPQPPEMEDSQTSQIETLLNEHEKDITNDP